jgi:hypothetical protein
LSHQISIVHNAARDQINEISLPETLLLTLTVLGVFELEKLVPDVHESFFGHAVITSVFVHNFFNLLDDLYNFFNFDDLFSNDRLFDNFFNSLDSIFVNNNLLNHLDLFYASLENWSFNFYLNLLNFSHRHFYFSVLELHSVNWNLNSRFNLMDGCVIDWDFDSFDYFFDFDCFDWHFDDMFVNLVVSNRFLNNFFNFDQLSRLNWDFYFFDNLLNLGRNNWNLNSLNYFLNLNFNDWTLDVFLDFNIFNDFNRNLDSDFLGDNLFDYNLDLLNDFDLFDNFVVNRDLDNPLNLNNFDDFDWNLNFLNDFSDDNSLDRNFNDFLNLNNLSVNNWLFYNFFNDLGRSFLKSHNLRRFLIDWLTNFMSLCYF